MATTLVSVVNVALSNAAAATASATIPVGANACFFGGTYYESGGQGINSFVCSALSSIVLDSKVGPSGNAMSAYGGYAKVNATGSQTFTVNKTSFYAEGPTLQIFFLTVDDPDDFVEEFEVCTPDTSHPATLSISLLAATADAVFAIFATDGSSADPSVPTGFTQRGSAQTNQTNKSIAFQKDTVTNPSVVTVGAREWPALIGISVKPGGGIDPGVQAETITFADSSVALAVFTAARAETITFADSQVARAANFAAAQAETISFVDSQVAAAKNFVAAQAETITLADSQDATYLFASAQEETITFADSQDAELVSGVVQQETIEFVDSATAVAALVAAQAEQITFADSQVANQLTAAVQEETITLADSQIAVAAAFVAQQAETISFADSQDAEIQTGSTVVEQITFVDEQTAFARFVAEITEGITFADSSTATGGAEPAAPVGGGWAPQLPRRKVDRDRVLDDVLEAIETLHPTKTLERKAKQAVHQLRRAKPVPLEQFIREVNMAEIEDRIAEIVVTAARKVKEKKRRKDDEEILLLL